MESSSGKYPKNNGQRENANNATIMCGVTQGPKTTNTQNAKNKSYSQPAEVDTQDLAPNKRLPENDHALATIKSLTEVALSARTDLELLQMQSFRNDPELLDRHIATVLDSADLAITVEYLHFDHKLS